jgi:hypothetical protein
MSHSTPQRGVAQSLNHPFREAQSNIVTTDPVTQLPHQVSQSRIRSSECFLHLFQRMHLATKRGTTRRPAAAQPLYPVTHYRDPLPLTVRPTQE